MGQTKTHKLHEPVLINEVLEALRVRALARSKKSAKFIDATLGLGGHSKEIVCLGGDVLGIEMDAEMLKIAQGFLREACPTPEARTRGSYTLVRGNFSLIDAIAKENDFSEVDGVLFDLGVSFAQLTSPKRGFSFQNPEAPLDMRMDPQTQGLRASDLLNVLREDQLLELFAKVLKSNEAKRLSRKIVEVREKRRIEKVGELVSIVKEILSPKKDLHLATLPFLALRMAVNSELENLDEVLPKALVQLKSGGRMVVISFHSAEDTIVKNFFKQKFARLEGRIITKKPIRPKEAEILENPRARSAKMRIFEKI